MSKFTSILGMGKLRAADLLISTGLLGFGIYSGEPLALGLGVAAFAITIYRPAPRIERFLKSRMSRQGATPERAATPEQNFPKPNRHARRALGRAGAGRARKTT